VRPTDSGYSAHVYARANGRKAIIKLNDELQFQVITADSEAGMVVRYVMPLQFDVDRERLVDEVVHGKVEIEFHDQVVL
jgi:peptide subunit release factor RF-3